MLSKLLGTLTKIHKEIYFHTTVAFSLPYLVNLPPPRNDMRNLSSVFININNSPHINYCDHAFDRTIFYLNLVAQTDSASRQ